MINRYPFEFTEEEMQAFFAYLLAHESDIAAGINDFADLRPLFFPVIGRMPREHN